MADWRYLAFEVYPLENDDGTLAECPIHTIGVLLNQLSATDYTGFISPLHGGDSLSDHAKSGKMHIHVCLKTNGRFSLKSVKKVLDSAGVRYANGILVQLDKKQDYINYCKYLTHRTNGSRHKQQFGHDAQAIAFNQPQSEYLSLFEHQYQNDVISLIKEQDIESPLHLMDMVGLCADDYYDDVWRDLTKWATFFTADRIRNAYR